MNQSKPTSFVGQGFVDTIGKHPWLILLVGLIVLGSITPGLKKIQTDFSHKGFFFDDDPMLLEFNAFERQFGNDDSLIIGVHSPSGIFDVDSASLVQELTEKMWLMPDIIRVTSLSNYSWVHAEGDDILVDPFLPDDQDLTQELLDNRKEIAMSHEVLPDYLVSKNGNTALLYARIRPSLEGIVEAPPIVEAARALSEELKRSDHSFYVVGGPAINASFKEATQTDLERLMPILLGLIVLCLLISLRSVVSTVLSLVVVVFTIVPAMAMSGWTGFPITSVTGVLPQILVAICVADSVHILSVFRQALRDGKLKNAAANYTLAKNFLPTLLTSISTSIGFFSFGTANLKSLAGLGTLAGCGVLLAWFVSYFILGPLLFILPSLIKPAPQEKLHTRITRATQFTAQVTKFRKPIIYAFTLLTIGAAGLTLNNEVNSDPYQYFAPGVALRDANDFITDEVGGARGLEIVVRAEKEDGVKELEFLQKVETFQKWLEAKPEVTRTLSVVDILKATHRSLNGGDQAFYKLPDNKEMIGQELFLYTMSLPQGMDINDRITLKNDAIRVTALWTISDSKRWMAAAAEVADHAAKSGLDITITGKGNIYQSMNPYVVESFVRSITIALVLISILLIVVFGSFKMGMIALLPNCIPLLLGGAAFWFLGKSIDIGSVLVMSVCLGIAVDDTIHILSNYNRLIKDGLSPQDAAAEVLAHTSPALIFTTIILVLGFGTLAFATFVPNIYFGIMTAIILTLALFTDLTFLLAVLTKPNPEQQA